VFNRGKVSWSPIETEYLAAHQSDIPVDQLTIYLGKSRNAIQKKIAELNGKISSVKKNSKSYIGKRADLNNTFFRSGWEADIARWLNFQNKHWFFEPKVFVFPGIKKGTLSYLPDFYLPEQDIFLEVKGFLTGQGKTAIRRMKRFFPEDFKKLRAITGSRNTKAAKFFVEIGVEIIATMDELKREYKDKIPNWES